MTKLRISIVQYLNTAPLVWGFTDGPLRGKYDLSFTVPSQCAEALRTGAADIAIIPAIEYQRIENLVVLPDLAIASKKLVRSLLLVSKLPIQDARSIALDSGSRSTQALTKILCDRHWKIAPKFLEAAPDAAAMLEKADAALLIGDPALRLSMRIDSAARRGSAGELVCAGTSAGVPHAATVHVYDVVEEWYRLTGLPAVLAVWAARSAVVTPEVIDDFHTSHHLGMLHVREISEHAALELHLPAAQLARYLTENIDFSLGEEHLRGLQHFFELSQQIGLLSRVKPLEVVAESGPPARVNDGKGSRGPGGTSTGSASETVSSDFDAPPATRSSGSRG